VLTPAGYPDSNGQDNSFEWITNVSFAGIDNTSGQEGGGYGDYSGQIGSIEQGEAALLSVTISADSQDYVNAWIDWNGDGDFTDAGEGYVLATNTGSNGPHTLMITAPNDAAVGTAILRVSLKYQGAAASDEVFQYGEVEDYSINVTAAGDQPPTDIVANGTEGGGLGLNDDGGNDAYLQADDGGAILGGLTSLTLESQFSITTQSADETTLLSYASSGSDNEVKLIIQSSGEIALSIGSSTQVTAASYPTLVDGQRHQVSASWDSATGAVAFYVDGVVVESFSGFQTGYTIASGGTLLFGQEQDAVGGGFETADQFQGALYDVRIFDDVRSGAEVASGYNATLSYDEGGLLANWDFDTFSTDGVVIDAVSGNNLTLLHVSGAGFSASTPALSLEVQENAANGTLVGSVTGVDAERDAEIAALLAADTDLRYSAETNKFYKVFTTGMNFSVAQANAGAALLNGEGGQLVTIRSAHEQNLIENYISGHSGEFYIGATDATTEGQWNWIDGGVEADRFWNGDATGSAPGGVYENWHADEPQGGAGENYAAIRQSDGIWLDNSGLGLKGSIVEWNADDVLDQTQPLTYDIQSQTVAGAFAIDADSGEITVADGSLIDFSANPIHSLTLRVADTSGNFYDEVFTINVESAPVTAVDNAYSLDEDATLTVDWWNTDWTRRQLLTFDNSGQTENLTDFAVLVKLNSTNIDYAQTQNGGQDLRFLDADGTALAHEIEQWNEAGDSYVWVKVPQIDGASATDHIQMYYGNATADDAQTPTEVWDGNYRGVWHLDETAVDEGSGAIHDDSAGDFDGVQDGNASALGQIGGGQVFDGLDDLIDLGTTTIIDGRSAFTISAWVKVDASPGTFDMYGVYSRIPSPTEEGTLNFNVGQWGPDDLHYLVPTNDGAWHDHVSDSEISVGTWANIVAAYDGAGTIRYYLNGNPDGSDSYTTPSDIAGLAQRIGMEKAGAAFDGVIDEVRVSDTERSADWIKAQHLSMTDSFVSFGGAQSAPLVDGVVATDLHNGNNTLTAILVSGPSQAAAFTFNADGTFSYTPNPGYHGSDSFTYKINDGSQDSNVATVDITVASVADAPVIGGVDSGSVTEDVGVVAGNLVASAGNLVASGSLTITDEDTGESSFQAETINGSYGDLTIDTAGNWSYSADNAQPAIQSLNTGESLVETLAVTTFDGSTHDVVITINGADEPNSTPELLSGELISNGNFDTDLSGWATAGTATWGPDGELRFGEFNDVGPHSASQTINTVAGETYRLIFDYRDDKTIFDQTLQVTVDGISQLLDSGNIVTDVLGETHVRYEYIFVADSATATVTFTDVSDIAGVSQGTIGVDGLIDNVSVRQINGPIGTASFTEDGPAVVLDAGISVFDPELSTQDNFDGATLTLERNGGANADDVFSATGTLGTLTQGGNIVVGATTIGSVTTNSAGTLQLSFNSSATNTLVNSALQQITYSNPNNTPPANVLLDWTFSDGNSGAQGSGGALQVIASTTVNITPANDAPAIGGDDSGTVIEDVAVVAGDINASGSLTVVDPDAGESSFQAETVNGSYGDLTIDTAGNWSYSADNSQLAIQALDAGESLAEVLTVTTFDGSTHNL